MRKKIIFIMMLFTFILPFFSYSAGDPMMAYGYQVTIWKYSGTGSPQQVGKPILIYHPDLFGDITIHKDVEYPTSYSALMSKNWGMSQIIDRDADSTWADTNTGTSVDGIFIDNLFGNPNNSGSNRVVEDEFGNEFIVHNQYFYSYDHSDLVCALEDKCHTAKSVCVTKSSDPRDSGRTGYQKYIIRYSTQYRIVTYKASDITNLGDYYKTYSDSNLTESNVVAGYLDNIIKNKYFKDIQAVKQYFGIDIDYSEIDKYYISIEPVQRVLDDIARLGKTFPLTTITYIKQEETTWGTSGSNSEFNKVWYATGEKCGAYECNCRNKKICSTVMAEDKASCLALGSKYEWNNGECQQCSTKRTCQTCYSGNIYNLDPRYNGIKNIYEIYGRYADGYSHIQTSRSLGTSEIHLKRAVDYCDNTDNKHCELENDNVTCKKDANGNIIYQYYIGPSLDKALVGTTSNNYYLLNGSCSNGVTGRKELGIKHYYLQDLISCKNTCESYISNKSSDEYLKCAENYCDAEVDFNLKGNARLRKKGCIISCGYTYGKSPTDGSSNGLDRESINSCSNSSPYNGIEKANVIVKTTSQCSIDNLTGDDLYKTNAIITTCVGDQITDFDGDDTNDTIFDHRTYINVACKETSGFGFADLTNKKLVAGEGIDYYAKLDGEKECTVYFNLEQWKFDYATISSKDPDRRKRLLYIYDIYNNALNDSYDRTKSPYYDADFLAQNDGEVEWSIYEYDKNKVTVLSRVREIVNNVVKISEEYKLIENSEDDSVNATIVGKESITQIYNMNIQYMPINRYVQISKKEVYYMFDKYCVSNDGKATVYKAPDNGVCYVSNGEDVIGRNVYYTDLNATRNKDFNDNIKNQGLGHAVMTDVSIGREVKDESIYYEDGESCEYKIDDTALGCTIIITSEEGTEMHGNDIYVKGGVTATLKANEKLGVEDEIENIGLTTGTTAIANGNKEIEINISDQKNGVEEIYITGIVESKKGQSAICKKKIYIIDPSDSCGVSCSVTRDNNDRLLYEIKSTGKQQPKQYLTALSTNMNFVVVLPTIGDNRYLVRLNKEVGNSDDGKGNIIYDDTIVYGKVEGTMVTTGEKCYNVCWSDVPELPNCSESINPADTGEVKNYCVKYWDSDINNYDNVDECINQCSKARMCAENNRDIAEVTDTCTNNYLEWGFSSASSCVNYCYYCPECSNDYLYRTVNNYNPFPYSSDSNTLGFNYPTGERIIPSNWVGKTEYIKQDDKDTSSVTGVNKNQKQEYVIELTPSVIKQIRQDTESYNNASAGNDAYLDYVYMEGVDTTKRYYSKFINETFRSSFTVIDGEQVR